MAAFDALTAVAVAAELHIALVEGRVQDVIQPDASSLGVEMYARRKRRYLYLCAHPQAARVHLLDQRPRRGVETPSPLLLSLRKRVEGARLSAVACLPYERVLHIDFDHPTQGRCRLIAEIMGRLSNLILIDDANNVIECLKRVGPAVNRVRVILPGQPYRPPPPQDKLSPNQVTAGAIAALLAQGPPRPLWRILVDGVGGLSPQAARELVQRAAGDATMMGPLADATSLPTSLPMSLAAALARELDRLWAEARAGATQAWLAQGEGALIAYAPYQITHAGQAIPVGSISQAIARFHAQGQTFDAYEGLRAQVRQELERARAHLERQRAALQRQLLDPAERQRLREAGEWILALASQIRPGQTALSVDVGEETPLTIMLDPHRSPAENARQYFVRYRKGQRAATEIPSRLTAIERDLEYLAQLALDLRLAESQPEIVAIREALTATGWRRESSSPRTAPLPQPIKVPLPDGLIALVGRNSRQNEELTFDLAAPDDLWLHVRGLPGAHVIVRCQGKPASEAAILRAAELAAYYSAARAETAALVVVAPRRKVRRLPGGHPGQVLYSGERTMRVRPRG